MGQILNQSKNASLPTPPAFGILKWVSLLEFRQDLLLHKSRVPTLSCNTVWVMYTCLAVLTELHLTKDKQKRVTINCDGQTLSVD